MELETRLGTLKVKKSSFTEDGYPGYYINMCDDKEDNLFTLLVEVDKYDDVCKIWVWDNINEEPAVRLSCKTQGWKTNICVGD